MSTIIRAFKICSFVVLSTIFLLALYIGVYRYQYNKWFNTILEIGPWTNESVWVSESKDICFVSYDSDEGFCDVYAYICSEGKLQQYSVYMINGAKRIRLVSQEQIGDELEFINGEFNITDDTITIENLNFSSKNASFLNGREQIKLIRQNCKNNLPYTLAYSLLH